MLFNITYGATVTRPRSCPLWWSSQDVRFGCVTVKGLTVGQDHW